MTSWETTRKRNEKDMAFDLLGCDAFGAGWLRKSYDDAN
jgi:hypothetical protein